LNVLLMVIPRDHDGGKCRYGPADGAVPNMTCRIWPCRVAMIPRTSGTLDDFVLLASIPVILTQIR
jgi:hypothetical protein